MPKDCVINVAAGGWYPAGQDRLVMGLYANGFTGGQLMWKNCFPRNRTHAEIPYGFKAFAFDEARKGGWERILWIDAAEVIEKSIQPIFDHIGKVGYFLIDNYGFNTGEWCSDAALGTLGLDREASFKLPHLMACVMGLDLTKPMCNEFLDQYLAFAQDGRSFQGSHSNANGEVSKDKRVRGHRHDQTVASVLTRRLGMDQWVSPFDWIYYPCWVNEEDRVKEKRASVIMVSNGGYANL